MILVEVFVPAVNKTYDFKLDENLNVFEIVEEMAEIITAQENNGLLLFDENSHKALLYNSTLKENSVGSGARLILV